MNCPRLVLREREAGHALLFWLTSVMEFNGIDVRAEKVEGDGRVSYHTDPMPLLAESRARWYQDRKNPMVPTGKHYPDFEDFTLLVWLTASFSRRIVYEIKSTDELTMDGPAFRKGHGREACKNLNCVGGTGAFQREGKIIVPQEGMERLSRWLAPRVDREVWNVAKEPEAAK